MRPHLLIRGGAGWLAALVLLTLALAACATAPASTSGPSTAPGSSAAATPAGAPLDVDGLVAALPGLDGATATVTGFLLLTGDQARLCAMTLESYPPQCGGATIRVLGAVPQAVVASLEHTNDPTLAQAIWGQVTITGTVAATGADGQPTITVGSIEVAPQIEG
jgi:hypothetical protein